MAHKIEALTEAPGSLYGNVLTWSDFKSNASSALTVKNSTGDFANGRHDEHTTQTC